MRLHFARRGRAFPPFIHPTKSEPPHGGGNVIVNSVHVVNGLPTSSDSAKSSSDTILFQSAQRDHGAGDVKSEVSSPKTGPSNRPVQNDPKRTGGLPSCWSPEFFLLNRSGTQPRSSPRLRSVLQSARCNIPGPFTSLASTAIGSGTCIQGDHGEWNASKTPSSQ